MKILIVEDSGIMRRAISKAVVENGFEPVEAENGAEAIVELDNHWNDISLVILDWHMPVMDGYETLIKIRASQEYGRIPVLMATTNGVKEQVIRAIKAGASDYLVKPFTTDVLANQIAKCLNKIPAKKVTH